MISHKPNAETKLHSWLLQTGSMTDSLKSICGQNFTFELLGQISIENSMGHHIERTVTMGNNCDVLLFAKTLFHPDSATKPNGILNQCQNRPLGEILFMDSNLTRSPIIVTAIDHSSPLFIEAMGYFSCDSPKLLLRQSTIIAHGESIELAEIASPKLEKYI